MLSRGRIMAPHRGHDDRGSTIERFAGTRSTTTVRNEPKARPASANVDPTTTVTPSLGYPPPGGI